MKTWKRLGIKGASVCLCVACHSKPADLPVQVVKSYYASGQVLRTAAVQNGQLNGPVVWYYRNGARQETARFMRGRAVGSKVLFDSTGTPVERHVSPAADTARASGSGCVHTLQPGSYG
jgi:hypothetical protein